MVFYISKHVLSLIQCKHCAILLKLHMKHSLDYLNYDDDDDGGGVFFPPPYRI